MHGFNRKPPKRSHEIKLEDVALGARDLAKRAWEVSAPTLRWLCTNRTGRKVLLAICAAGLGAGLALQFRKKIEVQLHRDKLSIVLDDIASRKSQFKYDPYSPDRLRGKLSPQEINERTKVYGPGVTIVEALNGLKFYACTADDAKSRDTEKLRRKLTPYFSYLADPSFDEKERGLNYGGYMMDRGALVPLAMNSQSLSDKEFLYHAHIGVKEMEQHPKYGKVVQHLVETVGREQLLELAVATAKKECGPFPIGYYQLFRSERIRGVKMYSWGAYHVLDNGPGRAAFQGLDFSPSNVINPVNGTKLWLAFLVHKSRALSGDYFYLDSIMPGAPDWLARYSEFYNGSAYKKNRYDQDISLYMNAISDFIDGTKKLSVLRPKSLRNFESPLEPKIEDLVRKAHDPDAKLGLRNDERSTWYVKLLKGPRMTREAASKGGKILVSINGNNVVRSASMNKVVVAIAYWSLVTDGKIQHTAEAAADLQLMLALSKNFATNNTINRIGAALGAKPGDDSAVACENYLRTKYPNTFNNTTVQYIPKNDRAYDFMTTTQEFAGILEKLYRSEFPNSKQILETMNHPTTHNRLVKGTSYVRKRIISAATKTGLIAGSVGDGGILTVKDRKGNEFVYIVVAIFHRPLKEEYKNDKSTYNFQKRANLYIRRASDEILDHLFEFER